MGISKEDLTIVVSDDRMTAMVECHISIPLPLDQEQIKLLLTRHGIRYGIDKDALESLTTISEHSELPIVIASGKPPINGKDGELKFVVDLGVKLLSSSDEYDFREVMEIPSVLPGQKIAYITEPVLGEDGIDVFGDTVKAISGRIPKIRAGKNVVFKESELAFYASSEGEARLMNDEFIQVNTVFEINESISMRTGNIDFAGSVIIHGDVPSGYKVRARGDIKVFGIVEAANINAQGSIFISEGFSGMKKGVLVAGEDVQAGYINQGTVCAGKNIVADSSILHSECIANESVTCLNGNIIGGVVTAGTLIEAKDLGNRLSTKTEVIFGLNEDFYEEEKRCLNMLEKLQIEQDKLIDLGEQILSRDYINNPRLRIALLRQRNKLQSVTEQMNDLNHRLNLSKSFEGKEQHAKLRVKQYLYPNVVIAFGKYKQTIQKDLYATEANLIDNEIKIYNM